MKPVDFSKGGEGPTKTLREQMQWALNHFLYATGQITEKPPDEPPVDEWKLAEDAARAARKKWVKKPRK